MAHSQMAGKGPKRMDRLVEYLCVAFNVLTALLRVLSAIIDVIDDDSSHGCGSD